MSIKKRRLDQLKIISPCSNDWNRMSGDEKKRFCSRCNKFVYDFSQMTQQQVDTIVSIHQGRMCARMTRWPDGSLITLETPPIHTVVAHRAPPVVNATLAAILCLSAPANGLNVAVSAAQLIARTDTNNDNARTPNGGGEALVGGTVRDWLGTNIPNAVVKLIPEEGAELKTKSTAEGEFAFAQVPYGAYIMLVEAQGFYTNVNTNVIVDTPHDMRFDLTMKAKPGPIMGGLMVSPLPLLDLYRNSDLVAIAYLGQSTIVDNEEGANLLKSALHISVQLKGQNSEPVIPFYYRDDDIHPTRLKPGGRLLVFLRHRESEDGNQLDGYELAGWEESIKVLDDGALAIYRQRIEELRAIFKGSNPDPAELVEWLVRCIEEPATREDGVRNMSEIVYALTLQHKQKNEANSETGEIDKSHDQMKDDEEDSIEPPGDDESEMEREITKLAAALTEDHKNRLTSALFDNAELTEADIGLAYLITEFGDPRLAPYLVSQLQRVSGDPPRFTESLVRILAYTVNDDDLKRLADDYDGAATYDESESDDESDQQDAIRNERSAGLTVAAIKRGAMVKDFLKLVEYKTRR